MLLRRIAGARQQISRVGRRYTVKEKAKSDTDRHSHLCVELIEKAKDDPELAKKLEVAYA
jgi:hypothetical protein